MKKAALLMGLVTLVVLSFFGVVKAQTFRTGSNTNIASNEVVDSTAYVAGNNLDIAGKVNGDLYCAGQTVTISGTIKGDVLCAAQTLTITGHVDGNSRSAAQTLTISGIIQKNASVAAQSITITKGGVIGFDITGVATTISINDGAIIGRDATIGAQNMLVNGEVGRNIKSRVNSLALGSTAKVVGNIDYTSQKTITIANGASVSGTVKQTEPKQRPASNFHFAAISGISIAIYFFFSMIVAVLALVLLFPSLYKESIAKTKNKFWMTLLYGFVGALTFPFVFILLMVTVIGIPLALLLGLLWALITLLSGSFFAYYIGSLIFQKQKHPVFVMLGGAVILFVAYCIPFVGFLAIIATYLIGVGIILRELMRRTPKPKY